MFPMFAVTEPSSLTSSVRKPAVKECLVGGTALGKAQVALALQRLERTQEHGLPAALAADPKECVECGEGDVADPSGTRSG